MYFSDEFRVYTRKTIGFSEHIIVILYLMWFKILQHWPPQTYYTHMCGNIHAHTHTLIHAHIHKHSRNPYNIPRSKNQNNMATLSNVSARAAYTHINTICVPSVNLRYTLAHIAHMSCSSLSSTFSSVSGCIYAQYSTLLQQGIFLSQRQFHNPY